MPTKVDPSEIENIVGVNRHPKHHFARAVSSEQTMYILHSQECKDQDLLMECEYTRALESGIEYGPVWRQWRDLQDRPVQVKVVSGFLFPVVTEWY